MRLALLALLVALPAAAASTAERDVARVFGELERLEKSEFNQTVDVIRATDKKMQKLAPSVLSWGHKALAPLEAVARDEKKPPKTRQLAVSVMGLTRDPGAFTPLEGIMRDAKLSDELRSEAALSLPGLTVSKPAQRAAFCAALADAELPRLTLHEALLEAARLGCDEPAPLDARLRRLGLRPSAADADQARLLLRALGRTSTPAAATALWKLFKSYPAGTAQRGAALEALLADEPRLAANPGESELGALDALREESGNPANAALAARLAGRVGTPDCAAALRRMLRHADPEVLAESAEGLARLKAADAKKDLEALVAGAHADPRFAPKDGRPDPAVQLARVRAAANAL